MKCKKYIDKKKIISLVLVITLLSTIFVQAALTDETSFIMRAASSRDTITIDPNGGSLSYDGVNVTSQKSFNLGTLINIGQTKSFNGNKTIDVKGTYSFEVSGGRGGSATITGLGSACGGDGVIINSEVIAIKKNTVISFFKGGVSDSKEYPNIDYNTVWDSGSIKNESYCVATSFGDNYNGVDINDFLYVVWGSGGNCSYIKFKKGDTNYSIYAAGGGCGTVFSYAYASSPVWAGYKCLTGKSAPLDMSDKTTDNSGVIFDSDLAYSSAHGGGTFANGSGLWAAGSERDVGNGKGFKSGMFGAVGANTAAGGTCGQSYIEGFSGSTFSTNTAQSSEAKMTCHSKTVSVSDPTRIGYTFDGWEITSGSSHTYSSRSGNSTSFATNAHGNFTIKAKWIPNTYTISYAKGLTDCSDNLTPSPTTATFDANVTLSNRGSLVGRSYKIDFNSNLPSGCTSTANLPQSVTGNLSPSYNFWYIGSDAYSNGNRFFAESQVIAAPNFRTNNGDNIVATAQWVTQNVAITGVPTMTGYSFQGWYDNPSCSGNPVTSVSVSPATTAFTKTLYAKWKPIEYDVVISNNRPPVASSNVSMTNPAGWAGGNSDYKLHVKYDQIYTVPSPQSVYSLTGWNVSSGFFQCDGAYDKLDEMHKDYNSAYRMVVGTANWNLTTRDGDVVYLNPYWIPNTYNVEYDGTGKTN